MTSEQDLPYRTALEGIVLQESIRQQKLDFRTDVAGGALQYAQHYYMLVLVERNVHQKYYDRLKSAYDKAVKQARGGTDGNNIGSGRDCNRGNIPG